MAVYKGFPDVSSLACILCIRFYNLLDFFQEFEKQLVEQEKDIHGLDIEAILAKSPPSKKYLG